MRERATGRAYLQEARCTRAGDWLLQGDGRTVYRSRRDVVSPRAAVTVVVRKRSQLIRHVREHIPLRRKRKRSRPRRVHVIRAYDLRAVSQIV